MHQIQPHYYPARAVIDLGAIRDNTAALIQAAGGSAMMAIVKADAYGHGMVPCAQAALAGGATWLGVAQACEALDLRGALGPTPRILTWLHSPGAPFAELIANQIDISVAATWALDAVAEAARAQGQTARIHLKVDTGLGRNGFMPSSLASAATRAATLESEGVLDVVGVWTHLAFADEPRHPMIAQQARVFDDAVRTVERAGITPEVRHVANSAATLTAPQLHYDLVRPGIAMYGYSPVPTEQPPSAFGLRPAMTLEAQLATVKAAPAGIGVSYSHRYHTTADTRLGDVPLGYADGIPRSASGGLDGVGGPVAIWSGADVRVVRVAGRVCMDQFVVDLGADATAQPGDVVTLFGPTDGLSYGAAVPNAEDWAQAAGTISYEIITRLGWRLPRVYLGAGCSSGCVCTCRNSS